MKNTKYSILVLKDDSGEPRHVQVSRYSLIIGAGLVLLLCFSGLIFGWLGLNKQQQADRIDALQQQIAQLEDANSRYSMASVEMEEQLSEFEEKAQKLASFVGVEPIISEGIGGADLDAEISPYLRDDLGVLVTKAELIEKEFDKLEGIFKDQAELLDATPSILPARGWISSGFRHRIDPFTKKRTWHNGIDVSAPKGTPIYAPADGVVTKKAYQGGLGNLLEISHASNIKTRYGHLDKFNVTKGQRVRRGDLIGYVGNTGRSTGSHLHYEIHQGDKAVNPMKFIIREPKSF